MSSETPKTPSQPRAQGSVGQWYARWSTEAKISAGLIVAFVLIIGGAVNSYQSTLQAIETSKSVEQSLLFTGGLDSLLLTVRDLHEAARDFAQTGKNGYRAQYQSMRASVQPQFDGLEKLVLGNEMRRQHLNFLSILTKGVESSSEDLVQARLQDGVEEAEKRLKTSQGPELMRLLLGKMNSIRDEERTILENQITEYQNNMRAAINTYSVVGLLVVMFFVVLGSALYHYMTVIRKGMEAEQRVSRDIVYYAPIGIVKVGNDLTINEANPVFCRYVGLSSDGVTGKKITDLVPELPKSSLSAAVQQGTTVQLENLFVRIAGKDEPAEHERYWDLTVWPIQENSSIHGMIVLVVDVTEKTNLSNQREVFAQTLTHDMKTPLIAADRIFDAILEQRVGTLGEEQADLLQKLKKNNQTVLKMVKDVLEISRYKQNSLPLNLEQVNLKEVVEHSIAELNSIGGSTKKVTFKTQIPKSLQPVWGDRTAIAHLVTNLLENAIKFSPNNAEVRVFARNMDNVVALAVNDSGGGMPEEDQSKIFKSSWQGDLGKTAPAGSGLGLYLCHQIANAHRGELTCQSTVGAGSTFTVYLPTSAQSRHIDVSQVSFDPNDEDDEELASDQRSKEFIPPRPGMI